MDGHRPTGALTDSALEREIETMLAVEPSPDFLARVRTRVSEEAPRASWFRWEFAAAAAVAVVIITAAVVWRSLEPTRSTDGPVQAALVAEKATPPAASNPTERALSAPAIERVRRGPDRLRARRTADSSDRLDLVAVIAPEDRTAFELLLSSIRKPEVVLVLSEDTTGPPALAAPSIKIAPIDIEPVPPVAQLEGGVE